MIARSNKPVLSYEILLPFDCPLVENDDYYFARYSSVSWVWILRPRYLDSVCNVKKKDKNTFFFVSTSREIYIFENERHCLVNVQLYLPRKTWISYVSASRLKTAFLPRTDAIRFLIDTWISHQRRKHLLQSGKCRSCVTLRPFQISKLPRISSVSPNTELSQSIKRQV